MLNTLGHTPGHHSLLVRLEKTANVLLTGDLTHFRENYENNQMPAWNASRADTLASLDRLKQIAGNLKALVIIHHDPRDVDIRWNDAAMSGGVGPRFRSLKSPARRG